MTSTVIARSRAERGHTCAIVGAGVGIGVSIPLLAALVALSFLLLRERRIAEELREQLIAYNKPGSNAGSSELETTARPLGELQTAPSNYSFQVDWPHIDTEPVFETTESFRGVNAI